MTTELLNRITESNNIAHRVHFTQGNFEATVCQGCIKSHGLNIDAENPYSRIRSVLQSFDSSEMYITDSPIICALCKESVGRRHPNEDNS